MKLVLFAFPQHVALRDGEAWVSPVRDIGRYIAISRRHLRSRWAAFRWVAGGMVMGTAFEFLLWLTALLSGYRVAAFWFACLCLGMYVVNVALMDLPWALRYRRACGDTSGMWQISPLSAVIFTVALLTFQILLIVVAKSK